MPPQRRSLSDRNRAAIAQEQPTPALPEPEVPPISQPTAESAPVRRAARKATDKTSAPSAAAPARQAANAGETSRLGVYLTPAEFEDAKAGYLAAWASGGSADTFTRWIAAAIDTYASQAPEERAKATPKGRSDERTGSTRSFSIPTDTVARMRAAITADQHAGRWPSDSAWCGEAIAYAVAAARQRNEGTLPIPPARLPNRLVR